MSFFKISFRIAMKLETQLEEGDLPIQLMLSFVVLFWNSSVYHWMPCILLPPGEEIRMPFLSWVLFSLQNLGISSTLSPHSCMSLLCSPTWISRNEGQLIGVMNWLSIYVSWKLVEWGSQLWDHKERGWSHTFNIWEPWSNTTYFARRRSSNMK